MKVSVASFYMHNIPAEIVCAQQRVVRRFLPAGCDFHQILTTLSHAQSMQEFVESKLHEADDIAVFLDVDCIPLNHGAIKRLVHTSQKDILIGCAQSYCNLAGGNNVFAAPAAMAFNLTLYNKIGRPLHSR